MGFQSHHAPQVWRAKLKSSQLVAVKKVGPNWTVQPTKGDELGSYGNYGTVVMVVAVVVVVVVVGECIINYHLFDPFCREKTCLVRDVSC